MMRLFSCTTQVGRCTSSSAECRRRMSRFGAVGLLPADPVSAMGSEEGWVTKKEQNEEDRKVRIGDRFSRQQQKRYRFPQRRGDHHLERGLSGDAKRIVAEAEAGYQKALESLSERPGGLTGGEEVLRIDEGGKQWTCRRYAAPFGETYVPSSSERFSLRGQVGQLTNPMHDEAWRLPEARALSDQSLLAEKKIHHIAQASGVPVEGKVGLLGAVLSSVFAAQLPLQPKTWTTLFTVLGQAHAAPLVQAYHTQQGRLARPVRDEVLSALSAPQQRNTKPTLEEHAAGDAPALISSSPESLKCLDWMRESYILMRSGFTAPTATVMEVLMGSLALSAATDRQTVHLAHRILLDADRFVVLPTRTTYAAYFDICNRCELMHFAVKRFADAVDRLHIEPDAAMATALLRGLNENGLIEEAVAMLARLEHIDTDVQLLNVSMETLLLSQDARAALAAYQAVVKDGSIAPSSETFTLMLLACERLSDWGPVKSILSDMQRFRVRGDAQCLNLLLKGLLLERLDAYAHQLYLTMRMKRVEVWPAVEAAVPDSIKQAVFALSRRTLRRLIRRRNARHDGNEPLALTRQVVRDAQRLTKAIHHGDDQDRGVIPKVGGSNATVGVDGSSSKRGERSGPVLIDLDELLEAHHASEHAKNKSTAEEEAL